MPYNESLKSEPSFFLIDLILKLSVILKSKPYRDGQTLT